MDIEKIETVVARHDEQIKQNCKDIEKLQDQTEAINKLAISVELIAQNSSITNERLDGLDTKIDRVDDKVNKLDKDLGEVKNKDDKEDAKKWREIVKYIMIFFVGSALTLLGKQIGLI